MDYTIAIPTYKRLNVFRRKTYRLLKRYNLCERVVLFLQCPEDVKEYTEAFPELKYVEAPSGFLNCINFIGEHFPIGHPIVQMHDDISLMYELVDGECKQATDAHQIFTEVFTLMTKYKLNLGGLFPIRHGLHMLQAVEREGEYSTKLKFIHDPITMLFNQRIPMIQTMKTDYERTIEYYKRDGGVVRINKYSFTTVYNPVNVEGGIGYRSPEVDMADAQLFKKKYERYVSHIRTHKKGTVHMILKDKSMLKYDIHEKPLIFESTDMYHKNAPHKGTRYAIVLYNKDFRWADTKSPRVHRTEPFAENKHDLEQTGDAYYLQSGTADVLPLLEALDATTFRPDRCSGPAKPHTKYVDAEKSTFLSFGLTLCRKSKEQQAMRGIPDRRGVNKNNTTHIHLFNQLCKYLNTLHPRLFGLDNTYFYSSLIVAKDALCRFHLDSLNKGNACILGIGDYTGGELLLNTGMSNVRLVSQPHVSGVGGAQCKECGACDDGQAVEKEE